MKKIIFTIISFFLITQFGFSQQSKLQSTSGKFVLSTGAGVTIAKTDYQKTVLGGIGKLTLGYNFPTSSNVIFGFNFFGGTGTFRGKDGIPGIPGIANEFKTKFSYAGIAPSITFILSDVVRPYIMVGVSRLWIYPMDVNNNDLPNFVSNVYDNKSFAGNVEVGLKLQTGKNISLDLMGGAFIGTNDTKDYFDDITTFTGTSNDIVFTSSINLTFYVGREDDSDGDGVIDSEDMCPNTPKGVKVDVLGCPLDTDGDGVADYLDKCPDTPKGVKVDPDGCPIDTDGDGVADYLDKCPDTPIGVAVDSNGCPLDSDGDGVPDYLDKCPDTPLGDKVDENGCSIKAPIILGADANFASNSSILLYKSHTKLDALAKNLIDNPQYSAVVEGHTDALGKAKYNMWLSKRRANSVVRYLVKKGVSLSRFVIKGFGESKPITTNKTKKGRAKNRRVEIKLKQESN